MISIALASKRRVLPVLFVCALLLGSAPLVSGRAAAATPDITITPGLIDLGNVSSGSVGLAYPVTITADTTVTIVGFQVLSGSAVASYFQDYWVFSHDSCSGMTLQTGSSCKVSIAFDAIPPPENQSGTLVVTYETQEGQQASIEGPELIGEQDSVPTVTPSSEDFGSQLIDTTTSAKVTFAQGLQLAVPTIGAVPAGFAASISCPPNDSVSAACTVTVSFTPTSTGPFSGSLTLPYTDDQGSTGELSIALSGTGVTAPQPSPLVQTASTGDLYGVNCLPTGCESVGSDGSSQLGEGVVLPVLNGTPGNPESAPSVVGNNGAFLNSVSCVTSSACIAVGESFTSTGSVIGDVTPIDDGTPETTQLVPGSYQLNRVACPDADTCIAVGNTTGSPTSGEGLFVVVTDGVVGPIELVQGTTDLQGIACANTNSCFAVGYSSPPGGVVVPISDGAAGTVESVPGIELGGVTCVSSTICYAVGADFSNPPDRGGVVEIKSGVPGAVEDTSGPAGAALDSISCSNTVNCVAVGSIGAQEGVADSITDGIPGPVQPVTGTQYLFDVSCVNSSCEAVGKTADAAGAVIGLSTSTELDRYVDAADSSTHWSTSNSEQPPTGFSDEGTLGYLFGPGPGMLALYSCVDGGDGNYLSIDQTGDCESAQNGLTPTNLGIEGYVYQSPPSDGTPVTELYRCFRENPSDHLETTIPPVMLDGQERCGEDPTDYAYEGTLGYIGTSSNPNVALPEAPIVALFPVVGAVIAGGIIVGRRSRRRIG